MKKLLMKIFLITLIYSSVNTANAATQHFIVNVGETIDISTNSSVLAANMDDADGHLNADLSIDFAIQTNILGEMSGIKLSAVVNNAAGAPSQAMFSESNGSVNNALAKIVFASQGSDVEDCATDGAIQACCSTGLCNCLDNENAVSYPATISIDNGGIIEYVSDERCFDVTLNITPANIGETTNLNVLLSRDCCPGTYSSPANIDDDSTDVEGNYEVEIMLTGIPGTSSGV